MGLSVLLYLKSILSRLIFIAHGTLAIYLYVEKQKNSNYWLLAIPLFLLVIESLITIVYRQGLEYKYFWPSGFLYITCFISLIWLIELDLYNKRTNFGETKRAEFNYTSLSSVEKIRITAEIYITAIDEKKNSNLKKLCELGLIVGIIIGRWLMPRGEMSKEQLSALLLMYVGNAADILELFAAFDEPEIMKNRKVITAVIFIFTWAMYQFSLVATITTKNETIKRRKLIKKDTRTLLYSGRELKVGGVEDLYIKTIRTRLNTSSPKGKGKRTVSGRAAHILPRIVPVNQGATRQKQKVIKYREIHGETFQILVTLLMQDGPFLILRLYLSMQFAVSSEMHIFFTAKNAFVSILLVYRLLILSCSGTDEESMWHREEAEARLQNIQVAMDDLMVNDATSKLYVQ